MYPSCLLYPRSLAYLHRVKMEPMRFLEFFNLVFSPFFPIQADDDGRD